MGIDYNPRIVTDGMILCLDADNTKSYPGSGSIWANISKVGNNASVLADVTYSSSPKRFVFDTSSSTNERIAIDHFDELNYSYLNWAYCFWIKQLSDDNGTWAQLFIKGNDNANRRPGVWFLSGNTSALHITWNNTGGAQQTLNTTADFLLPINTWHYIVIQSRNGTLMSFKDGIQDTNTITIADRTVNSEPLHIGHRGGYRSLAMEISNFTVYNKSLTNDEINQNFNALRGRYGV